MRHKTAFNSELCRIHIPDSTPHMVGLLRHTYGSELAQVVWDVISELLHLSSISISFHPTVKSWITPLNGYKDLWGLYQPCCNCHQITRNYKTSSTKALEAFIHVFMVFYVPDVAVFHYQVWISSGGTSSLLHSHADHNLHCVLDGRKDFIVIHPDHKHKFEYKDDVSTIPGRILTDCSYLV